MRELIAYVDGSYNNKTKEYGFGCLIIDKNKDKKLKLNGKDFDKAGSRNVTGELVATIKAIKYALKYNYEKIIINYDYTGIENWANLSWKANKNLTQDYVKFIIDSREKGLIIEFIKVKAHSGDEYNELVDKLAKEALGLI